MFGSNIYVLYKRKWKEKDGIKFNSISNNSNSGNNFSNGSIINND